MKKFMTTRFGEIEADEDAIITFESGIPAFEEEREFLIIPYEEGSPYVFLQSLKTPDLAFLMILTLSGTEIRDLTANLMAPIVVNAKTRRAKQIVLDRSPYTTKHRLFPDTKEDK